MTTIEDEIKIILLNKIKDTEPIQDRIAYIDAFKLFMEAVKIEKAIDIYCELD